MKKQFHGIVQWMLPLLTFILSQNIYAQKTAIYTYSDKTFIEAVDLFNKEKFGVAQELFQQVVEQNCEASVSQVKTDAEYYYTACAAELFHPDAEYLLLSFINSHPASPKERYAYWYLAKVYYKSDSYKKASDCFTKLSDKDLAKDDKIEYQFKLGYSYFRTNDFLKATECFGQIKDSANKYKSPALYYYSHIQYQTGNYETASKGFTALKDDETFAPIVPYYIAQILFLQKKYKDVIEYALPLLEKASVNRAPEISKMLAESYIKTKQNDKALAMYERYYQSAKATTKSDDYEIAYLYYTVAKYDKAAQFFSKLQGDNDSLTQNAYYHLADCYVKLDEKEKARNAFAAAAKLNADKAIKQDAMFDYAKLTFELSMSPFNEAIKSFQQFIDSFPQSNRADEAYGYLVKVFMSTKNYNDALQWLEKIKNRDNDASIAYERAAFYRGLEYYNDLDFPDAIAMFDKSQQFGVFDKHLYALAYYWRADANYRTNNFDKALSDYKIFVVSAGALGKKEYALAHYNVGYVYFKTKKYDEAGMWFRKYIGLDVAKDKVLGDACNRAGDCYFMRRNYDNAQKFYDLALTINQVDVEYAMFQKAFCEGLLKKTDEKIDILTKLCSQYPSSPYIANALFEIAETWCAKEQNAKAAPYYEKVITEFPHSIYVKKSLLQLGLIYYNTNQEDKALAAYKQFVNDYRSTPEAKNALAGIKNIYIEKNDVSNYLEYVKTIQGADAISQSAQDSLIYLTGEDAYMKDNCEKSNSIFGSYLSSFPLGIFTLNALYYRADCFVKANAVDSALKCYKAILEKPKNKYTEVALFNSSQMLFNKKDYAAALLAFAQLEQNAEQSSNILEARKGQLLCNIKLNNNVAIITTATNLLATENVPDELQREANFALANAYYQTLDMDKALEKFKEVAQDVKSEEGAESEYRVCDILFVKEKYDESEKEILSFLDQNTSHQFWLAKSYILWADIYAQRKDLFQAKHTLQSIIDNYTVKTDGIIDLAQQKLDKIVAQEEAPQVVDSSCDEEIEIK